MNLLVIHEKDRTDNEGIVISVASDIETAEFLIEEYYGEPNILNVKSTPGDANIERIYQIEVKEDDEISYFTVMLERFTLNEL